MVQTKLMVSHLRAASKFALTVALGCAHILKPILEFVDGASPRSPVLDAAVAVVLVALPLTYLVGVVLLYVHLAPPAAPAPPPGAASRLAAVAWTLASALLVALLAFLLLAVGSSPPSSGGLTPT